MLVFVLACLVLLLVAAAASAAYEQVATFAGVPGPVLEEKFSEEAQLAGVAGMAVNATGAGGVQPGTVYAAVDNNSVEHEVLGGGGSTGDSDRVVMFVPRPGGGLRFSERWNVHAEEGSYERCGPEGEVARPQCSVPRQDPTRGGTKGVAVAVDKVTGNVYVYGGFSKPEGGESEVVEYSPDGSKVIARFAVQAPFGSSISETPEKAHSLRAPGIGSLAVDDSGDVYLFDDEYLGTEFRLMEFRPTTPGDYEHYVYAGQSSDTGVTLKQPEGPEHPVFDAAGHLYVANEAGGIIFEFASAEPSAALLCRFKYAPGEIIAMTVDPDTGDVFFASEKEGGAIHQLSGASCGETGLFTEVSSFVVVPKRKMIGGLVFDPSRQYGPGRPDGVLYAGSSNDEGGKPGESALGFIFSGPQEFPPAVGAVSAAHVGATTAGLGALIDPEGSATRYRFQFLTDAEYEAGEPSEPFAQARETPVGGGFVGEGKVAVGVGASLEGLEADTGYRFRVIATSHCSFVEPERVCETVSATQRFHTFPEETAGLPDGRVYELVSPVQKNGGEVLPADPFIASCTSGCKPGRTLSHFPMLSAPDGNAVAYEGTGFSGEQGAPVENEYVARRDPHTGWQSTNLTPSVGKGQVSYSAFDASLTQDFVAGNAGALLSSQAPEGYMNVYAQSGSEPALLSPLVVEAPPDRPATGTGAFQINVAGSSADGSRVFFEANDALTAATSVAPSAVDGGPGKSNLYELSGGVLRLVNVMPGNTETFPSSKGLFGWVSSDGSRVFWSDSSGQVYVRVDGVETRKIGDSGGFLSASTDGSTVLLDDGCLYRLETEECVDLTVDREHAHQGGFQGLVGQSEDLSHVYFVDTAALTTVGEENANHEHAKAAKDNLYAWSEGNTKFIATLSGKDNETAELTLDWSALVAERTAEASAGGRFLAFVSHASLTGYDNTGPCESDHAGGFVSAPCSEVFLYDSSAGTLVCASCNRSGVRPLGRSVLRRIVGGIRPQPRYLSDEGRLFFDSQDSLVAADSNERVEDVYEYEPQGVPAGPHACGRESGCVDLISTGAGGEDSNFLAADPSGGNVFFTTRNQLVSADRDELIDVYDAREGGGVPSETETGRAECQGESCQPAPVIPNDSTPGSAGFEGAGDLVSPIEPRVVKKSLTRAQKLARALKACQAKPKRKRARCRAQARKRYAAATKTGTTSGRGGKR